MLAPGAADALVFVADGRFHLEAIMIANPWLPAYRWGVSWWLCYMMTRGHSCSNKPGDLSTHYRSCSVCVCVPL